MFLSRITLRERPDVGALLRELGDAYREHQALWRLFEPDPQARRDFLYRRDGERGSPRYLLLSERPPVREGRLWRIDPPKPFEPKLRAGQPLRFSLRVNPVVSRGGKRHDVVMDRKRSMGWKELPAAERPPLPELVQQACFEWLAARAERLGFEVAPDEVLAEGYQQRMARRGGRLIRFSTVDLSGLLTVRDPERLLQTLRQGVGPAKAFGCGLLLVRRP